MSISSLHKTVELLQYIIISGTLQSPVFHAVELCARQEIITGDLLCQLIL